MDLLSSWNEWIPGSVCLFPVRVRFRLAVCVRQTFLSVDYLLPEKVWALYSWIAIEFLVLTDQYSGRILDFRLTSGVHPATLPGEWCWPSVAWVGSLGPGNAWVWGICRFPWFSVAQCGAATPLCVLLCVHFHLDCTLLLLMLIFLKIQNKNVRSNLNNLLMIS